MATDAQILANQANAQLSTGPVTAEGKLASSHNAVKTGLTGQTVLLPSDDKEAYQSHVARIFAKFSPATDDERELVQSLADTEWRLLRIPSLEAAIYAVARYKLASLYPEVTDPAVRAALIEGEIQIAYRRDLSNLALQEARLLRRRKLDTEALEALQAPRKAALAARRNMDKAVELYLKAGELGNRFVPQLFGFEFSEEEIGEEVDRRTLKKHMVGQLNNLSPDQYDQLYWKFCEAKAS